MTRSGGQLAALGRREPRQTGRGGIDMLDLERGLAQVLHHHLRETVVVFDHQQLGVHGVILRPGGLAALKPV